jgi:cell filamentation protein
MTDPYTDPATGVLRNKLGVSDPAVLAAAEADITAARLARLSERPIPGSYDLPHLLAFHREIFGSIYPWAGQVRTVNIAKESTAFCPVQNIAAFAQDTFGRLARRDNFLRGLPLDEFVTKLTDLYGDINALHPAREGNGRAQRAYLAQLAVDAGYRLEWTGMDPERNRLASIASFNGHPGPLRALLADLTTPEAFAPNPLATRPSTPVIAPTPAPRPAGPRPRP